MKIRALLAVVIAVIFLCAVPVTASASIEEVPAPTVEVTPTPTPEPTPAPTPVPTPKPANPLTVDGTGTVLDTATEEDGKSFYTITTEAGNVFFLIIDHQKEEENVYFLNAVTEADLMALAEKSENSNSGSESVIPTPVPTPEPTPTPPESPPPAPVPDKDSGSGTSFLFLLFAAVAVGAVGWYFKIYIPSQELPDEEDDEFADTDEPADYGDYPDEEYFYEDQEDDEPEEYRRE